MEAMENGIQPVMINVREKDQMKQQRAYMGAVISLGDQKEIIPVVEPGLAMEYTLSTAIKKLSLVHKPTVGFLQGHGEPQINELMQAGQELGILYNVEQVTVNDSTPIPGHLKSLVIVRPTDSIPSLVLSELDKYLDRAFLSRLTEVSVVHGQGTGKLRSSLRDFLRNHPHVDRIEVEGGLTRVSLKV